MLSTRHKMAIARALNRVIVGGRRFAGRGPTVQAVRRGIRWRLDLNEGVDLALYLNLYQAVPARVLDNWVRKGSFIVDIGANIGAISLQLARSCSAAARVVAVEPTDFAYAKLLANVALNPGLSERIVPVQAALGDGTAGSSGNAEFYSRWPLREGQARRHAGHEGQFESAGGARFTTLDALVSELRSTGAAAGPVCFVKLDVDGHELAVLEGARGMLRSDKPAILIEIAPHVQDEVRGRFERLLELLASAGYALETASSGARLPNDAARLRERIAHGASIDALAVAA